MQRSTPGLGITVDSGRSRPLCTVGECLEAWEWAYAGNTHFLIMLVPIDRMIPT